MYQSSGYHNWDVICLIATLSIGFLQSSLDDGSSYVRETLARIVNAATEPDEKESLLRELMVRVGEDRTLTAADYASLAGFFGSGGDVEAWSMAREFAVAAKVKGGELDLALVAQMQDRILVAYGQPARFGLMGVADQAHPHGNVFLEFGLPFVGSAAPVIFESEQAYLGARLAALARRSAADVDHPNPELSEELGEMCASRKPEVLPDEWRELILGAVERDELVDADDFYHAGFVLAQATQLDDLILAHELVTISVALGHPGAEVVFCETWDKVCSAIGARVRYGTLGDAPIADSIGRAIRRTLGIEF